MEMRTIGEMIIGSIGVFLIVIGIGGVWWEATHPRYKHGGPSALVLVIIGLLLVGVVFIVHKREGT